MSRVSKPLSALTCALAPFLVIGLATAHAHASPEDIVGLGTQSPAMGGTGAAYASGFGATYTNPALLSLIHERRLSLGFQGASYSLSATGPGEPGNVSYDAAKGIVVGVALPIPFGGVLKDRIAIGLGAYTPTDIVVRGKILYPETPQFALFGDRTQSLAIRLGVGADITHGLRIGAGFAALAELVGNVVVATDASGRVGSNVDAQLVATYAPTFGASYEHDLGEGLVRVGATFRGELDARFGVSIDATKLSTLNIPVFNIAGLAQYDPAEGVLEGAYLTKDWTLALGVTYKHWSAYPGLIEPTILCPDGGTDCGALEPVKIDYSDTLVPRIGADRAFELSSLALMHLRAGYLFEPTPMPSTLPASQAWNSAQQTTGYVPTRNFDASRHVFSLGAGFELGKPIAYDPAPGVTFARHQKSERPFTLDLYTQLHALQPRTVTVAHGPNGEGDDPGFGDAKLTGTMLVVGIVGGVSF
jgi:long-chain fatty acid transport protein